MGPPKNRQRAQPLISRFFQKMRTPTGESQSKDQTRDEQRKPNLPGEPKSEIEDKGDTDSLPGRNVHDHRITDSLVIEDDDDDDDIIETRTVALESKKHTDPEPSKTVNEITHDNTKTDKNCDLRQFSYKKNHNIEAMQPNQNDRKSSEFCDKLNKIILGKRRINDEIKDNDSDDSDGMDEERETKNKKSNKKIKTSNSLTPLEQQIKDIKLENMDKILAVQVGYKYKFFAQDAVIVSQILNNMLLPGKLTIDESNPQDKFYKKYAYCSIPDNRLHIHLQKLMHYNLKVGVVEQVETQAIRDSGQFAKTSKQVFERKLTNVFTKATFNMNENFGKTAGKSFSKHGSSSTVCALEVLEKDDFLPNDINRAKYQVHIKLISIQLDTGIVTFDVFPDNLKFLNALETRLRHLKPIEIVHDGFLNKTVQNFIAKIDEQIIFYNIKLNSDDTEDNCLQCIKAKEVHDLILEKNLQKPIELLFTHLKTFDLQNSLVKLSLSTLQDFQNEQYMNLQANVLTNLEIFENSTQKDTLKGTLLWVLDHTRTSYGFAKLQHWISHPLTNIEEINNRLDAIECISKEVFNIFFENLNTWLGDAQNKNLLKTLNRIKYGKTSKREVFYYLKSLKSLCDLFKRHGKYVSEQIYNEANGRVARQSQLLKNILILCNDLCSVSSVDNLLTMINVDAVFSRKNDDDHLNFFNLNNYYNSQDILAKQRDIEGIKHDLQIELHEIRKVLKKPGCEFKDDVDFLIEVRNTLVDKIVPTDWIKVNSTKMVSRFKTPNVAKLLKNLQLEKDLLSQITEREYQSFVQKINDEYDQVFAILDNLAMYDCILSLSSASYSNDNYCRPKFTQDGIQNINIIDGRNPIIENMMFQNDSYVSNDVHMGIDNNQIMVLTGPNMGGKSSYIKQVALLVIMAQIGCYVPCSFMEISIFKSIFIRMGAQDSLIQGKSTFQMEILDILQILQNYNKDSLILLDEVGRGTGTIDGMSISYSILKYFIDLQENCPLILFITHFHSLVKTFHNNMVGIFHMSFYQESDSEDITFLYKITKGYMSKSFGMNVARLAKIDEAVVKNARGISQSLQDEYETNKKIYHCKKMLQLLIDTGKTTDKEAFAENVTNIKYFIDDVE